MTLKYTEEKLNSLDKETIIQLFLSQQEQLTNIDRTLHLVLEQVADLKRHRFGRSSETHEPDEQISFMEVDGKIVFFNESEAVAAEAAEEDEAAAPSRKPKKIKTGSGGDECQICQCGAPLPSGAGVWALRPAYFQTEHGELDNPVCRALSGGSL